MYNSQNPFICKDISPCTLSSKVEFLGIQADFNQVTTPELTAKINEQIVSEITTVPNLFESELYEVSEILRLRSDFFATTEVEG